MTGTTCPVAAAWGGLSGVAPVIARNTEEISAVWKALDAVAAERGDLLASTGTSGDILQNLSASVVHAKLPHLYGCRGSIHAPSVRTPRTCISQSK